MPDGPEIIAVLAPSPARRWAAVGFTATLGALCLAFVFLPPPAGPVWIGMLAALGGASLWLSRRLALATRTRIELTSGGLRDGNGRVLAAIEHIAAVERGAFALKPSSGFALRLTQPAPAAWEPGLWWRVGRRMGVGGVTSRDAGRLMADALAALLLQRSAGTRG